MIQRPGKRLQPASLDKLLVHLRAALHLNSAEALQMVVQQAIEQVREMRKRRDSYRAGKRKAKPSGADF